MGIDIYEARFLLACRQRNVDFTQTLMIGRQTLAMSARSLAYVVRKLGLPVQTDEIERITEVSAEYQYPFAERFFRMLGAETVESMDRSNYEGATIIADLAGKVPDELHGKFSAVVDCGTLEHVIDVRQGLSNCLSLVARGGHYVGILPSNNAMGHGFYQFSPEFFYRLLTPEAGFRIEVMHVCERAGIPRFRDVPDPARIGHRIELSNAQSTYLMVCARRIGNGRMEKQEVSQSDYVTAWEAVEKPEVPPNVRDRLGFLLKKHLPPPAFEVVRRVAAARRRRAAWQALPLVPWR